MIWIEKKLNLFDAAERVAMHKLLDEFVVMETPDLTRKNFYERHCIATSQYPVFVVNAIRYVAERVGYAYELRDMWINKVTCETNRDDHYHQDTSDLTMVLYLNNAFTGGEFEYLDYDTEVHVKHIKPAIDLAVFSTSDVVHRVLPVQSGIRYSLVCFFYESRDIY
jgi:Rps23 Pro-64 3,4-dihydroxylase Tpa1-like proline 4-hydroxylase